MFFNDTSLGLNKDIRCHACLYNHTFSTLADHRWIEQKGDTK